jgi:CBS domain-containing protein
MKEQKDDKLLVATDLMNKKVITFTPKTTVSEAIVTLTQNKISGAPVLDKEKKIIGIFTESDILKYFSVHPNQDITMLGVQIIYTENPLTIPPHMPLFKIQKILMENGYRSVPVVDEENHVIGMISRRAIMKYIFVVNKKRAEKNKN